MAAEGDDSGRVLCIQSSVVFGYVGNKCATFPLQLLGFDVCPIYSVQFSNHTGNSRLQRQNAQIERSGSLSTSSSFRPGYKTFKGQILHSNEVSDLYEGLKLNDINAFSHVLTGYIGSSTFLEKIQEIVTDLRKTNPNIIYACDPVMGDNGRMYVKPDLLPVYRDKVVPIADIVTPNQFELELLTGLTINSVTDALVAMQKIHDSGCKTVVLSSSKLGEDGYLLCLSSSIRNGTRECYSLNFPLLPAYFTGSGDLFAALLVAWLHRDSDLKVALEKTVASVQAVLNRTLGFAVSKSKEEGSDGGCFQQAMELRLVQSKRDIENPQIIYFARKLEP